MSKLTFPILLILSDGQFHSGEALAHHFKVSRATIFNALAHAQNIGVEIFSVRGRGYKLPNPITFLNAIAVKKAIGEKAHFFQVTILDQVDSTNTYLMQQNSTGNFNNRFANHASCVAAHIQTNGRGRRGRTWVSQLGSSLTFSLLWRFACGATSLSGLSLAVGIALIRAFKDFGIENTQLKWPNDVLVMDGTNGYQKLAGILIELQGDMESACIAVIGIGINLKLSPALQNSIDQASIDLAHLMKDPIDPNVLLGGLLNHLSTILTDFERHGFGQLREEWLGYHALHQQAIQLLHPNGSHTLGTVNDVAEDGVLIVNTDNGLQRVSSGEISLRALT